MIKAAANQPDRAEISGSQSQPQKLRPAVKRLLQKGELLGTSRSGIWAEEGISGERTGGLSFVIGEP